MPTPIARSIARHGNWLIAGLSIIAVALTRWPYRSRALFSWDSANFALGMLRIDIAAHRPHPPGYLGYVLASRALQRLIPDANAALVFWNIIATALMVCLIVQFAWELAASEALRSRMAIAAGVALMVITSPLVWFYGEVAEIYVSEQLVTFLIALTAWRALVKGGHNIVWCSAAIALAILFKSTAALFMFPLAFYAWVRSTASERRRAAVALVLLAGLTLACFVAIQPDLGKILWGHFVSTTSQSRLIGGGTDIGKSFNRNLRDTAIATLSGLGMVNTAALIAWAAVDRRLPSQISRRIAALWLAPWLGLVLAVHIAKAGYILPVLPLGYLVVAAFYSRLRWVAGVFLLTLQAVVNIGQFVWLQPPPQTAMGGTALYRNKSFLARTLSDLRGLAGPTVFTIRESDTYAAQLNDLIASRCPSGKAIIVAGVTVDYRRVLFYYPAATAIDIRDDSVAFIGASRNSASVPAAGVVLTSGCPIIWLNGENDRLSPYAPLASTRIGHLGSVSPPAALFVTPAGITVIAQQ